MTAAASLLAIARRLGGSALDLMLPPRARLRPSRSARRTACARPAGASCGCWRRPGAAAAASRCRMPSPMRRSARAVPSSRRRSIGRGRRCATMPTVAGSSWVSSGADDWTACRVRALDGAGGRGAAGRRRPDPAGAAAPLAAATSRLQPVRRAGAADRPASGRPWAPALLQRHRSTASQQGLGASARQQNITAARSGCDAPSGSPAPRCCWSTTCSPRAPRWPPARRSCVAPGPHGLTHWRWRGWSGTKPCLYDGCVAAA